MISVLAVYRLAMMEMSKEMVLRLHKADTFLIPKNCRIIQNSILAIIADL